MKKWDNLGSEDAGAFRIFRVRKQRNRSPDGRKEGDFYVIDSSDWVNVVALTPDNRVVLVEQYRHGTDELSLEIPGGVVDPDDASPLETAKRELAEETGYVSDEWVELGCTRPNPAIFSNRCYTFLASGARREKPQALDSMEEIDVREVPVGDIPRLIEQARISHSLIITGFYYFDLWSKRRGRSGKTS